MRRLVTFAVAWLFAAIAATTAAWQGVALVTHEVTDQRPAALGASQIEHKLDDTSPASITTTTPDAGATSTTAEGGTQPSTTASTTASTSAGTTPPTTTQPPRTTTTAAAESVTKTYHLVGGTTTIRFSPTEVTATLSTPNPGFDVKKEPEGTGIRVEFESDDHRSRIDAWWDGGPQVRPREDPR